MIHDITFPVWRRLFDLAEAFRQLAPWEWVREDQVFGLEHPENETQAFCVVLGKNQTQKGLAIYKGEQGLQTYLQSLAENGAPRLQNCILLTYEKLAAFSPDEQELIEWLEIEKKNNLPMFRDHSEGMAPWVLEEEEEARLMMFAVEQAISMAVQQKEEKMLLSSQGPGGLRILLKRPFRKGAILLWKDDWETFSLEDAPAQRAMANKLFLLSNCSKLPFKKEKQWAMEVYFSEELLHPAGQRPYYPRMLLVADASVDQPLGDFIFLPEEIHDQLEIRIKDLLVFEGYRPGRIRVPNKRSYEFLVEIGEILGIPIQRSDEPFPLLEEMKASIMEGGGGIANEE